MVTANIYASPFLSLTTSVPDVTALVPGDTAIFDVDLSEMTAGDELEFLAWYASA